MSFATVTVYVDLATPQEQLSGGPLNGPAPWTAQEEQSAGSSLSSPAPSLQEQQLAAALEQGVLTLQSGIPVSQAEALGLPLCVPIQVRCALTVNTPHLQLGGQAAVPVVLF